MRLVFVTDYQSGETVFQQASNTSRKSQDEEMAEMKETFRKQCNSLAGAFSMGVGCGVHVIGLLVCVV